MRRGWCDGCPARQRCWAPPRENERPSESDGCFGAAQPGVTEPGTGPSDRDQRRVSRWLTLLHALDGVAALCPACHRDMPGWTVSSRPPSSPTRDGSSSATAARTATDSKTCTPPSGRHLAPTSSPPVGWVPTPISPTRRYLCDGRARRAGAGQQHQAVFAFPVQFEAQTVGILSVYRATAGPLTAADHRVDRYARTASDPAPCHYARHQRRCDEHATTR